MKMKDFLEFVCMFCIFAGAIYLMNTIAWFSLYVNGDLDTGITIISQFINCVLGFLLIFVGGVYVLGGYAK